MSDFQTDPGYDPYAMDPETAALVQQLAGTGYQPYPQMLNVPYTKDLLGVGTDPLRNLGGAQTRYKSAASIMDYNPVQGFAGPEFEPYVPQYDSVAQEAQGDQYAEALLQDLQDGQGALALANQIDQATYTKEDGGPVEGKPLSPEQAKNYKSWLSRAQKAYTADSLELGKRQQQSTEGDVNSMVPTDEAMNFNEDQWINQIAKTGALGNQRQELSRQPAVAPGAKNVNTLPVFPSSFNTPNGKTPVALQGKRPPPGAQVNGGTPISRLFQSAERGGYNQREMGYRDQARSAVQNSVKPSPARERAVRAVMAYRLAMGLPAS